MAHKIHLAKSTLFIDEQGKANVKTHKINNIPLISCGTGAANKKNAYLYSLEILRWEDFAKLDINEKCKNCQKIYEEKLQKLREERKRYNELQLN